MSERLLYALLAGAAAAAATWLALTAAARSRERVVALLGGARPLSAEASERNWPRPSPLLRTVGLLVPSTVDRLLPRSPALADLHPDERMEWGSARRGVLVVLALLTFVVAAAFGAPWLLALLPALPLFANVLVGRLLDAVRSDLRRRLEGEVSSAVDTFVLALEAGLPFERALLAYAEANDTLLGRELTVTARELDVGYRRQEVLARLVGRSGSDSLSALASAVRLADDFGTPLANALRSLGTEMRARRRQHIQEAALRAPVTMLLPTAGFILLPIFAIILGPIALRILTGTLF